MDRRAGIQVQSRRDDLSIESTDAFASVAP